MADSSDFDLTSLLGSLGSIYSGVTGSETASSMQSIINNAYSFNSSRPAYVAELNNLMENPESAVTSSPGYQAEMDQALQASQRTAASQGLTGSGTEAQALTTTAANVEQSTYNNMFSQLAELAGVNLNPAEAVQAESTAGQTSQNSSSSLLSGIGGLASLAAAFF